MSILIRSALLAGSIYGIRQAARLVGDLDINDALGTIGLARRATFADRALPAAGLVAVGALVGAGAALLLAPSSGTALRSRLSGSVDDLKHRLDELGDKGKSVIGNTQSQNSTHSMHS